MDRWQPDLQFAAGSQGANTEPIDLPVEDEARLYDPLANQLQSPLYVRAISLDLGAPDTGPKLGRLWIRRERGLVELSSDAIDRWQVSNVVSGLLGNPVKNYTYQFRLWKPYVMLPGTSLQVTFGGVTNQTTYGFATGINATLFHCFFGVGLRTGQSYRFTGAASSSDQYTKVHLNERDEPIAINSLAAVGDSNGPYPLIKVRGQDGLPWSVRERPLWMFGEPYFRARLVFDFMPEGAVVLGYNEGFVFECRDPAGAALTGKLALESYRRIG